MEYTYENGKVFVKGIKELSLKATLECGQCFRWKEIADGKYTGVAFKKEVTVSFVRDTLVIEGCENGDFENIWCNYFDLDCDYEKIRDDLGKLHPILHTASQYAAGIRILRQEPFEALISFIISQNNNIKRISGIVERLCENFGEKLPSGSYAFPRASVLASLSVEELAPIRAGFRHRYIIDAAQKISSGEIDLGKLQNMPTDDARKVLMSIVGVGKKVADCTLLYGLHRTEVFPIDVWMKRAMAAFFPNSDPSFFGEYAGVAQQYIFHYSRMHPEDVA